MWYEILPSGLLVVGLVALSQVPFPIESYLTIGKPCSKICRDPVDYIHYRRDAKLDPTDRGNAHLPRYFEDVPDLPKSDA